MNNSSRNGFVGRKSELARLAQIFEQVSAGNYDAGRVVLMRGRRRVGKTRLVREFVRKAKAPSIQFFATGADTEYELVRFRDAIRDSNINPAAAAAGLPQTWYEAFTMLAGVLPVDKPSIVVIDEVPYLTRADKAFEGALQAAWDTKLMHLPVLLILIGSEMSAMERMASYGRPFYQRGIDMEVRPLTVPDVATMTGLSAADAFDAYLVTGGLPLLLAEWPEGGKVVDYLKQALANPSSGLVTSGLAVMAAEFPPDAKPKQVLRAIGSGEMAFTKILNKSAIQYPATLTSALEVLAERRIIAKVNPLSVRPNKKNPQYRITDPYLRFYSSFIDDNADAISGGFWQPAFNRIQREWNLWRGKAIEPVIRDLLPSQWGRLMPEFDIIGSWWNANSAVEVDIVAGDKAPVPSKIVAVGSIKWRDTKPFTDEDALELSNAASLVPGYDSTTSLIAVSRTPVEAEGIIAITPADLLE